MKRGCVCVLTESCLDVAEKEDSCSRIEEGRHERVESEYEKSDGMKG